jgi:hypothetical protein
MDRLYANSESVSVNISYKAYPKLELSLVDQNNLACLNLNLLWLNNMTQGRSIARPASDCNTIVGHSKH